MQRAASERAVACWAMVLGQAGFGSGGTSTSIRQGRPRWLTEGEFRPAGYPVLTAMRHQWMGFAWCGRFDDQRRQRLVLAAGPEFLGKVSADHPGADAELDCHRPDVRRIKYADHRPG